MTDIDAVRSDGTMERTADGGCLDGHPTAWDWDAFAEAQAQYASVGLAPAVAS